MKPTKSPMSNLLALVIAFTSTVGVTAAQQAGANPLPTAGKQIRVQLSLHVTGTYQHTGPKIIPKGAQSLLVKHSLDNSYTTEYVVAADDAFTGLQKLNSLDPASQREMDDYSAKVKAQADRIYHSADNLRGKGPGAPAGLRAAMNPMAMMANPGFMQKIMACGKDQACQQKAAMEMMTQQQQTVAGSGGKMLGDVQAISNMCINEKHQKMGTKSYEDCMNAEGEKRSTVKRTAADNEPEVAELPDRYFLYRNGGNDCQVKVHAKINETATIGRVDGGEGGADYAEGVGTNKGEADNDPLAGVYLCQAKAAFDTKTNLFWGGKLHRVDVQPTGTGIPINPMEARHEIDEWVASTLQGVPANGTKTQTFGYQTATLTWSFVRE
jgi:hypothetical protein